MDLVTTNCMNNRFAQHAVMVFKDPHFESGFEDGVDNLYDIGKANPDDEITGWAYYKDLKGLRTKDTEIKYSKSSDIPIRIGGAGDNDTPDVGTLVKPPTYPEGDQPSCWTNRGVEVDSVDGVEVPIPSKFRYTSVRKTEVDTFVGVTGVYITGRRIASLFSEPVIRGAGTLEDPKTEDTIIWASINESAETVFKLNEGKEYTVAYKSEDDGNKIPYIVFADNSRKNDPAEYGNNTVVHITRFCKHFQSTEKTTETITVLPIAETQGIWVKQIYVMIQLNTPSISIFDPDGENNKAVEIAEKMDYLVSPIVTVSKPNPIAFNGELLDLSQSKQDHDPTTSQDFEDTEFELALDEMDGGGVSLTFTFLDENGCKKLSDVLYDYMNSLDGIETVYVCAPNCDPQLGGYGPSGGTINSIQYSYTDSGSYTMSVNEGPRLAGGFAEVTGGVTAKAAESMQAEGTIIQDAGNHIYFKVRLDGFGERWAINCAPDILRVGDRVSCSVNNNPVES